MKFGSCESCATLREVLEFERKRFEMLSEKYHELRVSGANAPEGAKGLAIAPRPSKPADQAIETIVDRSNGNVALRRRLQRFVNLERQKPDADEDTIADRVLHWSSGEDEDAA